MMIMSLNSLRLIKVIKIISMTTHASLLSIITSTKLVFSRWPYVILDGAVTTIFWIIFNVFDQLLFFSPVVTFYLPEDPLGRDGLTWEDKAHKELAVAMIHSQAKKNSGAYTQGYVDSFKQFIIRAFEVGQNYATERP
jgi:hypothetical protein